LQHSTGVNVRTRRTRKRSHRQPPPEPTPLFAAAATPSPRPHPQARWTTYRGAVLDRDAYVAGNTDGSLRWYSQQFLDPAIVVTGAAMLTLVVVDQVEYDPDPATNRLRLTMTWVKSSERWLCLAGHAGPRVANDDV
jgi:hypothetical protein